MATPKKVDVNPKNTQKWVRELRQASERRGGDASTKFRIRYMFSYIDTLLQYQIPMPPTQVDEDKQYFVCPRCGIGWDTHETGNTIDDFIGCPNCLQRWKEGGVVCSQQ